MWMQTGTREAFAAYTMAAIAASPWKASSLGWIARITGAFVGDGKDLFDIHQHGAQPPLSIINMQMASPLLAKSSFAGEG